MTEAALPARIVVAIFVVFGCIAGRRSAPMKAEERRPGACSLFSFI
ncbi:hypothetical protein [Brevundimonas sp.]